MDIRHDRFPFRTVKRVPTNIEYRTYMIRFKRFFQFSLVYLRRHQCLAFFIRFVNGVKGDLTGLPYFFFDAHLRDQRFDICGARRCEIRFFGTFEAKKNRQHGE